MHRGMLGVMRAKALIIAGGCLPLVLAIGLLARGCRNFVDIGYADRKAREQVQLIDEVRTLLPGLTSQISHLSGTHGELQWWGSLVICDQYKLTIWIPLRRDFNGIDWVWKQRGEPLADIAEVISVQPLDRGRVKVSYRNLDGVDLDALLDQLRAGRSLTAYLESIGESCDQPVPGIELVPK